MRKKRTGTRWVILLSLVACIVIYLFFAIEQAEKRVRIAKEKLALDNVREFQQLVEEATTEYTTRMPPDRPLAEEKRIQEARERIALMAEAEIYLNEHFLNVPIWGELESALFKDLNTWTFEQWEEAEQFLNGLAEFIDFLHPIASMNGPLYPVDLSKGVEIDTEHLNIHRQIARILAADAIMQARNGNLDVAISDIQTQIGLAKGIAQEPLIISQLVSYSLVNIAYQSTEEAIKPGALSDAQLQSLFETFTSTTNGEQLAGALSWEVGLFRQQLDNDSNWLSSSALSTFFANLSDSHSYEIIRYVVDGAQLPYYEAIENIETMNEAIEELPFYAFHARNFGQAMSDMLVSPAIVEARIGLLEIGLSLENYYATHGSYPETLDAITTMLGDIPIDPFTGNPFVYKPSGDTFTLYSLGRNLIDDGGVEESSLKGDIVWRTE